MKIIAFRLLSGQDLRKEIEARVKAAECRSAFILTCAGGASAVRLRLPGAQAFKTIVDNLEIVSLAGTISKDGDAHLHGSFSDSEGSVWGGHIADGCVVRLCAEVVLGVSEKLEFNRVYDNDTGYDELVVTDVPGPIKDQ